MVAAPTLTTNTDPPIVTVVFGGSDLPAGTATATLYRIFDGVTTTVRSAENIFAVGGFRADDVEAPSGIPISYRAQAFDASGNDLGYTPTATVTVPALSPDYGWLSNPLDPAREPIRIIMEGSAGQGPQRPIPGNVYQVGTRVVALVGVRGLRQDLDMPFFTETTADREAIQDLITDTNGLILIRTPPPMMVPRLLYCWAPNPIPEEFNLPIGMEDIAWTNTVQEISPIRGNPVSSLIPWQIYIDAFPTWADFNAAYLTWLDAIKSPPEV